MAERGTKRKWKLTVHKSRRGDIWMRLKGGNGVIVLSGHGYNRRSTAVEIARRIDRAFRERRVVMPK